MQTSVAKKLFAVGVAASTVLMGLAPYAASAAAHAEGTNVNKNGTVGMIIGGQFRPYTSAGAFLSYGFNTWGSVVTANAEDNALPVGAFIPPQDGTVFCATETKGTDVKGECALITGGQKASFTSAAVFTGLGFSFSRAEYGDSSFLNKSSNIDNSTAAHRAGVLVNNNGTVQLVGANGLLGIPDIATFNSWGYSWADVVSANAADKAMTQTGVMAARVAGQLSPSALASVPGQPVPTGSVIVSAAADQTASATLPKSATSVNVLKFVVSNNGSSAVTVNQVTVKRTGAGLPGDFSNVYVYQGSSRLTSGRSINSSTNEAVFSGLSVNVPANGSVTLSILADVQASPTVGGVHTFAVTSVVMGSTSATGTATGNTFTIGGVSAGTITIAKSGTITNPKAGQTGVRIASFTLSAATEDMTVKRVSLYQAGAVTRTNLSNFVLKQAGNTLSSVSALDSKDKMNFDLNYSLAKGDTKTFEVYADVAGGTRTGTSETLKVYLEEATDLYAVGNTYGFGVAVTSTTYDGTTACTSASGDCSYATIDGGTLTITSSGPIAKDIAKNGKDVEIFNFTMAAQANLEVRQMAIIFNNGGSGTANFNDGTDPNYTDVKIIDTSSGAVVWGPQDLSGTGSSTVQTLTFTEDVNLSAGTSRTFKVTMDVGNGSDIANNDKIGATLDISGINTNNMVKNVDNNTYLTATDIVPTSDLAGNQMTIKTSTLTVDRAGTPTSQSYVKGTNGVSAVGLTFAASTANEVKVTDITITGMIDGGTPDGTLVAGVDTTNVSDDVTTVELYDGSTKIGETKSPAVTTGVSQFTGLNWVVPAGTTKTLTVKINISSNATANDVLKFGIAASGVTAVDPNGNSVSVTLTGSAVNQDTSTTVGTAITVASTGSLTVASAGTSAADGTDARIVTAGSSGVTIGKAKFTASNEELKITKMRVNIYSSTTTAVSIQDDVTSVSLYDGSTRIAGPVSVTPTGSYSAYVDFNSMDSEFKIPKNGNKVLTIKADVNTIDGGADSGSEFAVNVDTTNNFEARGTSGSTILTSIGSGSYTSQYMVIRKSQPKFESVALPSGTIANGSSNTVFRFKVTAVDGDVALKHLGFTTSTTTGVTVATPAISEMGGSNITITSSSTVATNGVFGITFNSEEVITAGNSKTYDFKLTITGADTGDSVTTSLTGVDTAVVTGDLGALDGTQTLRDQDAAIANGTAVGNASSANAANYYLIWSDMAATAHSDAAGTTSSDDWTNGRYVKDLTISQGLSK